jgi:hypothetical protein
MGGHKAIRGAHRAWLLQRIRAGDFTLRGLVAELAEHGLKVDYRSVWSFVHAEKLSFKKTVVAGERERPDVARRRAQWIKYQPRIEPERLMFIDETWTKTNMAPLRGWGPRGSRVLAKVPHGHWETTTFLAALRHDRIDAPWLLDGPIDGESFAIYVEQVLCLTLHPGDIVVMDNLGSHKGGRVAPADPRHRRQALLPAEILPGPKPDRAALCQAQALPAQRRRPYSRGRLLRNRRDPRQLHSPGMRCLLRELRLCTNVTTSRSSFAAGTAPTDDVQVGTA